MKCRLVMLGLLALSGCVTRQDEAFRLRDAAKEECRRQTFPDEMAKAACLNAADAKLIGVVPNADLIRTSMATRMALAEKVQTKQLTRAQAELEYARMNQAIASEAEVRAARASSVQAQERSAAAQEAMANSLANPPMTYQVPRRRRVDCRSELITNGTVETSCH